MTASSRLPETPADLFRFKLRDALKFKATIAFFRALGIWNHPAPAAGDFEKMRFYDKAYWLHKTTRPIRRAERGSGLEAHFAAQAGYDYALPAGFRPEPGPRGELTASAVGDLINHAFLENSAESLYAEVADDVFGADLAMGNLECPVVRDAAREFVFRTDAAPPLSYDERNYAVVRGHDDRRFAFLSTACNHSLDYGARGVDSTIGALVRDGIAYHGMNAAEDDADRARIVEKNGFRVGIVSFTFGLNAYRPPDDRPRIVNVMRLNEGVAANDFAQLRTQLAHCRAEKVDFVFAHLHWGMEHEFYPRKAQVELAHHVAELGVDAIVGHHPHVIQPMEHYRTRRDPDRVVPIYYSLGNLVNFFRAPYLCRSGLARLVLAKGIAADGTPRTYVREARQEELVQTVDESARRIRIRRADVIKSA